MGMNTTNGRLSGAMRLTSADTDPAQINVSNKKYILGNSTIDLQNDIIQATLLNINNENVETTLRTVYSNNNSSLNSISPISGISFVSFIESKSTGKSNPQSSNFSASHSFAN